MALSIKDPETDALVRKLANARGTSFTGAVKLAVSNELGRDPKPQRRFEEVWAEIQDIQKRFAERDELMTAKEIDAWMYDENGLPR